MRCMWYFDAVLSVIPSSKIFKIQHVNGLFLNDVGVFFKKKKEKKKEQYFKRGLVFGSSQSARTSRPVSSSQPVATTTMVNDRAL
jgi:hypothetical protein